MGFSEHLERYFAGGEHAVIAPAGAAVQKRLPELRVWRIAPAADGEPWTYATCGASQPGEGETGAEYVLLAPAEDTVIAEMLGALATVNADAHEGLGVGSVIALGKPWTAHSWARHLLVLPPYPFAPGFEVHEDGARRTVVLWLVPILAAEARFVGERGYQALEQIIERLRTNVADPGRASVV